MTSSRCTQRTLGHYRGGKVRDDRGLDFGDIKCQSKGKHFLLLFMNGSFVEAFTQSPIRPLFPSHRQYAK